MNRADALALMHEYTSKEGLRKHMLSVEAAMRAYAPRFGGDVETWGIVGLLHDFDYERWPDPPNHPLQGSAILKEKGYPDEVIYAIKSHADYLTDCPRVSPMDKALYACDELTGLVMATALMQPAGIGAVTVQSVRKKMKNKGFAAAINRDDLVRAATDLGVDLDEHVGVVLGAMQAIAVDLGFPPQ
jgi:putative nucleotidyltransferase with HDIG domain